MSLLRGRELPYIRSAAWRWASSAPSISSSPSTILGNKTLLWSFVPTLDTFPFLSFFFIKHIQRVAYCLLSHLSFLPPCSSVWRYLPSITHWDSSFKKSFLWLHLPAASQIFPSQTFLGHLSPLTTSSDMVVPWLPGQHAFLIFLPFVLPWKLFP